MVTLIYIVVLKYIIFYQYKSWFELDYTIFAFNHCFHYCLKKNERLDYFKYYEGIHCIVYQGVNKSMGIYRTYLLQPRIRSENTMHEKGTIPTVSTVTPIVTISNTHTPAATVKPCGFTVGTVLDATIVLFLLFRKNKEVCMNSHKTL